MDERAITRGMRSNHPTIDEDSASRLLQGLVHPDDAPPGYAAVAGLLNSAAQLGTVDEDAAATTVSAMVEVIRSAPPVPQAPGRRSLLAKLLAGKALAAMAVVGLTATGAAAATGTLPGPVQGVVSDAVSHVGVNLPHPDHGKSAAHRQDGEHRQDGKDDQSGDDEGHPGDDPAGEPGKGEIISGITHDPALDGQPKGPTVCEVASDGQCRAGADKSNGAPGAPGAPETGTTGINRGPDNNSGNGDANPGAGGQGADDAHRNDEVKGGATSTTVTTDATTSTTADSSHGASNSNGKGQSDSHN